MPIHPDWQELYRSFVDQYGEEKGEEAFYAYCKKHGIDYTKPLPKRESFSWTGSIEEIPEKSNLIRGQALHPVKTYHTDEWPSVRVYLEEELSKSAQTLAGKPLLLDHLFTLDGKVLDARYEDGAIEYTASLEEPTILNKIRDGQIKHCSVEFEWDSLKNVNGVAPIGINFIGLSLLSPGMEPGDIHSSVGLWEAVIQRLKEAKQSKEQAEPQEFIYYGVRDPAAFLEDRFSTVWIDRFNGVQGIYGRLRDAPENPQPMALLFMRANNWDTDRVKLWVQEHPQYVRGPEGVPPAVGVQTGPVQTPPKPVQILIGMKEMEKMMNEAIETKVKHVLKEQEDEMERLRQEQRQRAERYGISPKEGGHLTKPSEYERLSDDQFADTVNYRYPIDADHVRAALTYFNQADNRRAGGYNHGEQVKIMTKIVQAALNNNIQVDWQPDDPVYRDLPEELKSKLAGYEKRGEGQTSPEKQVEALQNQLTIITGQKEALEDEVKALKEKLSKKGLGEAIVNPVDSSTIPVCLINRKDVVAKLDAIIPPDFVIRQHGAGGFLKLVQDVRRVKREIEG